MNPLDIIDITEDGYVTAHCGDGTVKYQAGNATETVYVVQDASGEYLSGKHEGERTPASDEAKEFETREDAKAACERTTDRVISRTVETETKEQASEIMCRSVGTRLGRAMARDVIAENMPREWAGLDPQDVDQIPPELAKYHDEVKDWAREAYKAALQEPH